MEKMLNQVSLHNEHVDILLLFLILTCLNGCFGGCAGSLVIFVQLGLRLTMSLNKCNHCNEIMDKAVCEVHAIIFSLGTCGVQIKIR